jgi:hypothetical protein
MIKARHRRWAAAAAAVLLPLLFAQAAQAISLIKIREVYPGSNNDSYVELQAYSNFFFAGDTLPGRSLILFTPDGTPTQSFTFTQHNELGADDTSFLIGDTGVEGAFGVTPDITDSQMNIDPAGGAACWNIGDTPVDCVSWGDFTGRERLVAFAGTDVGNPASPGGITPGKSIERTIAPNCPTWLEADDDTDDSATDFFETGPNPQPAGDFNFAETPCESGMPDDTAIGQEPSDPSDSSSAHFTYTATGATSYQCKLDSFPRFTACPEGGQDYSELSDGQHTFQVRALNASGPDKTPAKYVWTVDTTAPQATILSHPRPQSVGREASFTFSSSEPGSTFMCGLDSAPASSCESGVTLHSLSTGPHTFHVAAVDLAGNIQAPAASFSWTVESNPPVTTIDTKPDNPTSSSTAAFTYHASRPDTFFECSLDGSSYASCPTEGATYAGLASGSHTFSVRAIDSDGDVEANPPSYSFTVGTSSSTAPKLTCKKGSRKKKVNGRVRCARVRRHKRHH